MTNDRARQASRSPLLFISHRHDDKDIAELLRKFVTDRSGGRIRVFQSSSAQADNTRIGRDLQRELMDQLWAAGAVVLIYRSEEEDWSYCMWECGVAMHPESPDTKVVVLQCGPRAPKVFEGAVRIKATDQVDAQKFVNEFLTDQSFFPGYGEAVAPGFAANGDEVKNAANQLYGGLQELIGDDADEGDDWATVPFMRLQLSYMEVDAVRRFGVADGARAVREAARVAEIDGEAKRLFGLGRVESLSPLSRLLDSWQQSRPEDPTTWIDELIEQVRVGSHWRLPRFGWQLMASVDDADRARYAPILSRVRSVPRQRCHHFDVYFSKFDTNQEGAVRIGFVDEPQAPAATPPDSDPRNLSATPGSG
jgi:hypothetical protein